MIQQMSQRLSPRAKKIALRSSAGQQRVSALAEVAPSADRQTLQREVENLGGVIQSWSDAARTVTVEIDAGRLSALADTDGVVYVEAGETYQP
jgi:hypothetical protein